MGVVARRAMPVFDRTVEHGLCFLDQALVAVEAEIFAGFRQQLGRIAGMGRVTGRTASF